MCNDSGTLRREYCAEHNDVVLDFKKYTNLEHGHAASARGLLENSRYLRSGHSIA